MTNSNKPTPAPTNPTIDELLQQGFLQAITNATDSTYNPSDNSTMAKNMAHNYGQALYAAILNSLPKGSLMYREDVLARVKALFDIQEGTNNDL